MPNRSKTVRRVKRRNNNNKDIFIFTKDLNLFNLMLIMISAFTILFLDSDLTTLIFTIKILVLR